MKTALVFGGSGYIGSQLANALCDSGHKVTVIDKATHRGITLNPSIDFILADIRSIDFCRPYDIVYHLADISSSSDSFVLPNEYITTNIWGTYNIIKSFPETRVVFASSHAATDAHNVYGITKKSAEHFVNLHKNSVSVRFMNVFGEHQPLFNQAVPIFCTALKQNKKVVLFGNGKAQRDWIYTPDLVDELIRIGNSKIKGITETGYGTSISTYELYHLIARTAKKKANWKFAAARTWDYSHPGSKYKIKEPKYGFGEGLRRTVRYYLEGSIE